MFKLLSRTTDHEQSEVEKLKAQIAKLNDKICTLEQRSNQLSKDKQFLQKENQRLQEENYELKEAKLSRIRDEIALHENYLPTCILKKLSSFNTPEEIAVYLLDEVYGAIGANDNLRKFLFGRGPNAPITPGSEAGVSPAAGGESENTAAGKSQDEQIAAAEQELKEVKRKRGSRRGKLEIVTEHAARAVAGLAKLKQAKENEVAQAIVGREQDKPEGLNKERKPSPGKKKLHNQLPKEQHTKRLTVAEIQQEWICPNCGSNLCETVEDTVTNLVNSLSANGLVTKLANGTFMVEGQRATVECKQCGFRDVIEGAHFPLTPGGSIDMQTVVTAGFMAVSGISINTVKKMFLREANLGNSTIYDNIQTLGRFCLPLCEYISERVDRATVALFDESTYTVISKEEGSHKEYVCIKATPHIEESPVIFFGSPGSRSNVKEFIQGFSEDAKERGVQKSVTTDAYPTYLSEFGQNEQISHQVCLAHFFCYVFDAVDMLPGDHLADSLQCTTEQLLKSICEQQSSQYSCSLGIQLMTIVCYKLSLIFDWEDRALLEHQQQGGDLYELRGRYRTEHSRLLMQDVDVLLQQLVPHYCICHGKTMGSRIKGDHIGKAVAYYFNQKAQLWTFVDHPHCELSQNFIEQSAKALARVRNAALFSRSPESAIAISRILTVVHTAAANKIRDIPRYLFELCSRVRHDCQRGLRLKAFQESGGEHPGRLNYNRDEVYSGYKLPEELLPENWVKTHHGD